MKPEDRRREVINFGWPRCAVGVAQIAVTLLTSSKVCLTSGIKRDIES
jgi:hypothetical protein